MRGIWEFAKFPNTSHYLRFKGLTGLFFHSILFLLLEEDKCIS